MPGIVVPPNVKPYTDNIQARPSYLVDKPHEGRMQVNVAIDWSLGTGFSFNLANPSPQGFSKVAALFCDNINCASDVTFIWPDTQIEVTVPANSQGLYPAGVGTAFVVSAPTGGAGDTTFVQFFNYYPYPVAVTKSVFQTAALANGINATVTGLTTILPTTINGVLQSASVTARILGGASNTQINFTVQDGTGAAIMKSGFYGQSNAANNAVVVNSTGINVKFRQGLVFNVTSVVNAPNAGSVFDFNGYYR
jgi:hypothetical protein